jgi:hypothetical protein
VGIGGFRPSPRGGFPTTSRGLSVWTVHWGALGLTSDRQSVANKSAQTKEKKGEITMEWNRSEVLGLSREKCTSCEGTGVRETKDGDTACACVLRAIFRICYNRFIECTGSGTEAGRMSPNYAMTCDRAAAWGRKDEEYCADFILVARRTLTEEEYKIFKFHFLLGADWRLCCRRLKMEKGNFFHAIYRIMAKLGKTFRELQPYALYPLASYFSSTMQTATSTKVVAIKPEGAGLNGTIPVKKAA